MLADEGFDIWLANVRGNRYSRNHVVLSPDGVRENRREFWDFTFHEMGVYDLSATIDYVLTTTKTEKIHYIGYSQGAAQFLILGAERPAYNDKIIVANLFAPTVILNPTTNLAFNVAKPFISSIVDLLNVIGAYELPTNNLMGLLGQYFCTNFINNKLVCENILQVIGKPTNEMNDVCVNMINRLSNYVSIDSIYFHRQ